MVEFEFNSPIETADLVEFFARCGWEDDEAAAKLEWALASSDDWVLCKKDGELIGFGRSSSLGPLNRVVFDVMVDSRFQGRGLRSEIVRLLSSNVGGMEEVSIYSDAESFVRDLRGVEVAGGPTKFPLAASDTYLGKPQGPFGTGEK